MGDSQEGSRSLASGGLAVQQQREYQDSRAEAVQRTQANIGEVASIFRKMAVLVTGQEESIQSLFDDVTHTLDNVEDGQRHLVQHWRHMSSNRRLIVKVFLILVFLVLFFVAFLA